MFSTVAQKILGIPAPEPPDGDDGRIAAMLKHVQDEVLSGLMNCKVHLDEALENQAFFDWDGERYIPIRDAETGFDFQGREKRQSGFLAECIDVLTEDLYCPGPSRTFSDAAGEEFLARVWADNLYPALMYRSDTLSHLNRVVAIQVDAGEGDWDELPCTLRLWGREEFYAWTDPDDIRKPVAVVTIDRFDLTTRYRLWTDKEVQTYETKKADGTAGGTAAVFVRTEPNTYGMIPFGFFWYELPLRSFYPASPGTFLRKGEVRIDDRLSRMDESINKHLNPIWLAKNMPDGWQPIIEAMRVMIVRSSGPKMGSKGFEAGADPEVTALQVRIDIEGSWNDLMKYINQLLEAMRVPLTAVRMEQSGTASGFALMVEQAPLAKRARKRRIPAHFSECYITRVILTCCGNHYGKPELVDAAKTGRLTLAWPQPTIPVPGPDRDQTNENAIKLGTKSRLIVIQEEYGCDRDQAIAIMRQIKADRDLEDTIDPPPPAADAPPLVPSIPESETS